MEPLLVVQQGLVECITPISGREIEPGCVVQRVSASMDRLCREVFQVALQ